MDEFQENVDKLGILADELVALLPAELPTSYTEADESPIRESLGHLRRAFELFTQVGVKKPVERAERGVVDRRHDGEAGIAHLPTDGELDAERAIHAGLCPCCGERIGVVDGRLQCPLCHQPLWRGMPEKPKPS
jgi:hypothetical protein